MTAIYSKIISFNSILFQITSAMFIILLSLICINHFILFSFIHAYEFKCPTDWHEYGFNCYQFIRSPVKTYDEGREACNKYNAFLLSVLSIEEHNFITDWLRQNDPLHQSWYTSAVDITNNNAWRWNVPAVALNQIGSTSSISSSNNFEFGSGGSGRIRPYDTIDTTSVGQRNGGGQDYYSILAALWLPQDNHSHQHQHNQQQIAIDVWSNRNAKNAVYKSVNLLTIYLSMHTI